MTHKRRESRKERSARLSELRENEPKSNGSARQRYVTVIGVAIVLLCTLVIYAQTVNVPTIDYEDPFYLLRSAYVNVSSPFSRLGAVWTEPYFANFHPVTTTTWLVDRAFADKKKPFDSLPFRTTHLFYGVVGASLVIVLYRRLQIPAMLAVLGGVLYAVHPIHTEVMAWLSARKDLISLVFILMSFCAWIWARDAETPTQWRMRYATAIVFALLAVLSKPIAVILPPLVVAYEFCSAPHPCLLGGRWSEKAGSTLLRRTLTLAALFVVIGVGSTAVFRLLLARDSRHGGWLIFIPLILLLCVLAIAPGMGELAAFREGKQTGMRVIGLPFAVLSVVFGAGAAWTFWAQQQVGAIRASAALLPTLNVTFEAMLAYAGRAFLPMHMSVSYTWSEYPNLSVRGVLGAALICAVLWIAVRLAGSPDSNRRLISFGIFWYVIALLPVSNLVATSTKMADRYLFVPTVGSILVLLGLMTPVFSASNRGRLAAWVAMVLIAAVYTAWAYGRTQVWCGKTTRWNNLSQPNLSLWTAAVEVNPEDTLALSNLGLAYLELDPPQSEKALSYLTHALEAGEANQRKVTVEGRIDLSPIHEGMADAYFAKASALAGGPMDSVAWRQKKEAYSSAAKFYRLALEFPSGFASDEARELSRLSESDEGQAQLDAQEIGAVPLQQREALTRERDELRHESESSVQRARERLVEGNVPPTDPNFRMATLDWGNIIFNRESGATGEEKARYYQEALRRYQEAETLLPDDPRPLLYQGLCYERLTAGTTSDEERRREFSLGEVVLRRTLTLGADFPGYSPALPYRELAILYTHMNDYGSALEQLKKARQAADNSAEAASVEKDIRSLEEYLAQRNVKK